jgi:hypothetical protein
VTKPDDGTLTPDQLANIERHSDRLLRAAAAHGRFPTPIADILAEAKLTVVDDEFLNESVLQRFFQKVKTVGLATLKSALSKVIGLFEPHDRLVVIDKGVPRAKRPFVKLHEAGHGFLPHQAGMYALIHDCEKTLDPDITDLFEREANVFASETMFQGKGFSQEAHAEGFSIKVPIRLATKFGASNYSSFRRYVTTSPHVCCLVVLEPVRLQPDQTFAAEVRRIVATQSFNVMYNSVALFQSITNAHAIAPAIPIGRRRMTRPTEIVLRDRNKEQRVCVAEAFDTTHQIMVLVRDVGPVKRSTLVVPGSREFAIEVRNIVAR